MTTFRRRSLDELARRSTSAEQSGVIAVAQTIVDDVRRRGEAAVREHAERLNGLKQGTPLIVTRPELDAAFAGLEPDERERLTRVADRIRTFA